MAKTFYEWLQSQPVLKDDVIKPLFDFARNIAVSALIVGGGFYWIKHPTNDSELLRTSSILFMIFGGLFLFLFNLLHGLKKLGEAGVPSKVLVLIGLLLFVPLVGVLTGLSQGK